MSINASISMPVRLLCLLGACTLYVAPALAAVPDAFPNLLPEAIPAATTQTDPLPPLALGNIVIRLENTTLAEVQHSLGKGVIQTTGDAGESLTFLCYTLGNSQRLWLGASEMGGTHIDTVAARSLPAGTRATGACPYLPTTTATHFTNGIWLGASQANATRILGQGKTIRAGKLYAFEKPLQNGTLSSTLLIRYTQGRISELHATRVTSD